MWVIAVFLMAQVQTPRQQQKQEYRSLSGWDEGWFGQWTETAVGGWQRQRHWWWACDLFLTFCHQKKRRKLTPQDTRGNKREWRRGMRRLCDRWEVGEQRATGEDHTTGMIRLHGCESPEGVWRSCGVVQSRFPWLRAMLEKERLHGIQKTPIALTVCLWEVFNRSACGFNYVRLVYGGLCKLHDNTWRKYTTIFTQHTKPQHSTKH